MTMQLVVKMETCVPSLACNSNSLFPTNPDQVRKKLVMKDKQSIAWEENEVHIGDSVFVTVCYELKPD